VDQDHRIAFGIRRGGNPGLDKDPGGGHGGHRDGRHTAARTFHETLSSHLAETLAVSVTGTHRLVIARPGHRQNYGVVPTYVKAPFLYLGARKGAIMYFDRAARAARKDGGA
jgi:hypothetical protein